MDKSELLGHLFTLRAGLSAVSIEADECKTIKNDLDSLEEYNEGEEIVAKRKLLEDKIKTRSEKQQSLNSLNSEKGRIKEFDKWQQRELKEKQKHKVWDYIKRIFTVVFSFILFLISISIVGLGVINLVDCIGFFDIWTVTDNGIGFLVGIGHLTSPLFIVGGIYFVFRVKLFGRFSIFKKFIYDCSMLSLKDYKYLERSIEERKSEIKEIEVKEKLLIQEISQLEREISQLKSDIEELSEQEYEEWVDERNEYIAEQVEILSEKTLCAQESYNALKNSFAPVLNERDWKNVDIIIYLLQSLRADTLKEALNSLDQLTFRNEILTITKQGLFSIQKTIQENFITLREVLAKGFIVISDQIKLLGQQNVILGEQLATIANNQQIIISQQAITEDRLSKILNEKALQNALLKKSNQTMEQIVDSCKEINNQQVKDYSRKYLGIVV